MTVSVFHRVTVSVDRVTVAIAQIIAEIIAQIMGLIRPDGEARLEQGSYRTVFQPDHINRSKRRSDAIGIPQTHQAYVVAAIRMKRIFVVPPDQLLTSGPDLRILVLLDRKHVVYQVSVLLCRPSDHISEQRSHQHEEHLHLEHRRGLRAMFPMCRGSSDTGIGNRIT